MSTSVVLLNWNELNVARDSIRRLLKEPEVDQLVVVDNGSTDGSVEYFKTINHEKFEAILIESNAGPSVGRNYGIKECIGENIFLIDGDILYVKGTIKEYTRILEKYQDAFCVGQNNFTDVIGQGFNGTGEVVEASQEMPSRYVISDWFPMAWTQYGLFRGNLLRETMFVEEGAFGEQGYGLEDDWYFHEMKEKGYLSLSVDQPVYYHDAHSGIKEILKISNRAQLLKNSEARKKIFYKKWGKRTQWSEWVADNQPEKTTRKNP